VADILELGVPDGTTRLDLPVKDILNAQSAQNLAEVTVLGRTHDGEFYLASSIGDCYRTYFWLDYAKRALLVD
jgi:hypothetical protein